MSEGIVYQNKDILFKILGQTYKEKSFAAYGIDPVSYTHLRAHET